MKLSQFKQYLNEVSNLTFILPNGSIVPKHFHITEVGVVSKHFIDCGGTVRKEDAISLQLWVASDVDHRLESSKLQNIIQISEAKVGLQDVEVEVEYQMDTISRYGLDFDGQSFLLTPTFTDCLAKDNCGIPAEKTKVKLGEATSCCAPGGGCC